MQPSVGREHRALWHPCGAEAYIEELVGLANVGVLEVSQLLLGEASVMLAVQHPPLLPGHAIVCRMDGF